MKQVTFEHCYFGVNGIQSDSQIETLCSVNCTEANFFVKGPFDIKICNFVEMGSNFKSVVNIFALCFS